MIASGFCLRNFLILAQGRRTPGYCSLAGLGVQRSKFRKRRPLELAGTKTKWGEPPIKSPGNLLGVPLNPRLTVMPYMHRPRLHDSSCEQPLSGTCKLTTTRDLTNGRFSHSNQLKWKGPVNNQGIQQKPQNGPFMLFAVWLETCPNKAWK